MERREEPRERGKQGGGVVVVVVRQREAGQGEAKTSVTKDREGEVGWEPRAPVGDRAAGQGSLGEEDQGGTGRG